MGCGFERFERDKSLGVQLTVHGRTIHIEEVLFVFKCKISNKISKEYNIILLYYHADTLFRFRTLYYIYIRLSVLYNKRPYIILCYRRVRIFRYR